MFALLKLIQSIIKTLHSDGTPGQVAAGMALGAALGLTPLMNVHNLVVFSLILLLNVSFGGGMLGWALFVPVGFLLDPLFHAIGLQLLEAPSLREPLDRLVQHAAHPLHQLQQHRGAGQRGRVAGDGGPDLLRGALGRGPLPRDDRRPGAAVEVLQGDHGVEGVQHLPPLPAGVRRWP